MKFGPNTAGARYVDALVVAALLARADADPAMPMTQAAPQQVTAQIAEIDKYTRSVRVVASTPNAVEGQAAVTSWDLERFLKNPVVLWAHDSTQIPIGLAQDVEWDPAIGLTMRIYFASEKANPFAEQVWAGVQERLIRAVSVGFDPPDAGGKARLVELSVVPIGLDEDAGTPALNPAADEDPEEAQRTRLKLAASELAKALHRKRAAAKAVEKTDAKQEPVDRFDLADGEVLRMDRTAMRLDKMRETPTGGRVIPAVLARAGVLKYADPTKPDGWRRELVLPEEAFNADAVATIEHGAVIDIKHHNGMVTPDTWKQAALGHVANVRADGNFMRAELHVNDREMLDTIEKGDRLDVSCGYKCRLDMTPGVWQGERYDCVQRGRVYNHLALCPPNGGRAGPEVGLRLDGKSAPEWGVSHYEGEEKMTIKVRLDGREVEEHSKDHFDTLLKLHGAEVSSLKAEHDKVLGEMKTKLDAAEGAKDAALQTIEGLKADAKEKKAKDDEEKKKDEEGFKFKARARRVLERMALRFLTEDEDDKEKMDALDAFLDKATDREVMVRIIQKLPGGEKFDGKDRHGNEADDVYVRARFDMLVDQAPANAGRSVNDVVKTAQQHQQHHQVRNDGNDPVTAARKARDEAAARAGLPPTT